MSTLFFETFSQEPNKTLVLSLDFDGCTDTPEGRTNLIEYITDYCKRNPHYENIHIAIGSLRQSAYSDVNNAHMNSIHFAGRVQSCEILLGEFVTELESKLTDEIENPPLVNKMELLTADIYHNLAEGSTLELIRSKLNDYKTLYDFDGFRTIDIVDKHCRNISYFNVDQYEEWHENEYKHLEDNEKIKYLSGWSISLDEFNEYHEWRESFEEIIWNLQDLDDNTINALSILGPMEIASSSTFHFDDVSKCLTLYNLFQHMYEKIKTTFDLIQVDDKTDILENIEKHYIKNRHHIPRGCNYQSLEWISHRNFRLENARSRTIICGNGRANPDYANTVRNIAKDCLMRGICSQDSLSENIPQPNPETPYLRILAPTPRRNVPMSFDAEPSNALNGNDLKQQKL